MRSPRRRRLRGRHLSAAHAPPRPPSRSFRHRPPQQKLSSATSSTAGLQLLRPSKAHGRQSNASPPPTRSARHVDQQHQHHLPGPSCRRWSGQAAGYGEEDGADGGGAVDGGAA